jgi:hypothetical protein
MRLSLIVAALASLLWAGSAAVAQSACRVPAEACVFVDGFLTALNQRDWAAFRLALDASISVFLEEPAPPERFDGRAPAERLFARIFPPPEGPRPPLPPPIVPLHLRARDFGDIVIVSFEIARPNTTARRTLVLHRTAAGWRIVHIHGSARAAPEG